MLRLIRKYKSSSDRLLARFSHKLSSIQMRQSAPPAVVPHACHKKRAKGNESLNSTPPGLPL